MHDPKRSEGLFFCVSQGVVGGIGVGEFGFAAPFGDLHRRQDGGFLRALVTEWGAAVDMPVERRSQVGRRGVLRGVQRDRVNARDGMMTVGGVIDLAEAAAESNLRLGIKSQTTKDQDSVVLQRL